MVSLSRCILFCRFTNETEILKTGFSHDNFTNLNFDLHQFTEYKMIKIQEMCPERDVNVGLEGDIHILVWYSTMQNLCEAGKQKHSH